MLLVNPTLGFQIANVETIRQKLRYAGYSMFYLDANTVANIPEMTHRRVYLPKTSKKIANLAW